VVKKNTQKDLLTNKKNVRPPPTPKLKRKMTKKKKKKKTHNHPHTANQKPQYYTRGEEAFSQIFVCCTENLRRKVGEGVCDAHCFVFVWVLIFKKQEGERISEKKRDVVVRGRASKDRDGEMRWWEISWRDNQGIPYRNSASQGRLKKGREKKVPPHPPLMVSAADRVLFFHEFVI